MTGVAISAGFADPAPSAERRASRPSIWAPASMLSDLVGDVAEDPRRGLDDQASRNHRALDGSAEPGLVGLDIAGDAALRALDQLGAFDVAVDSAVDMELRIGGDVAADHGLGADEGKAGSAAPHLLGGRAWSSSGRVRT